MQQCQICFKVADDLYVAPPFAGESEVRARIDQVWRAATPAPPNLLFFLHEGVLRAMLCGLGEKAGVSSVYWAYGICFYDLETKSTARIRSSSWVQTVSLPATSSWRQPARNPSSCRHLVKSIQQLNLGTPPEVLWTTSEPQREAARQ